MSYASAARNRYVTNTISTTTPAQLLVMLYDRLVLDLTRAADAATAGDVATVHDNLVHAQEIVLQLRSSLDETAWSGGPGLAQLYRFVEDELVQANIEKKAGRITAIKDLVIPLAEAWRQATAAPAPAAPVQSIRASA
ncbi:flagellar export chaperone FliS [Euzebya sp.]|uniref:flagellar export chaperone FliS n=1 Tax=Euzebya sp. TaxID=1971409 RepID=UPI003517EB26